MNGFASMNARHAFGLEALAEMTGKLLQGAYQRASHPADREDQDRAILLFDRLARGFRLTLALEARLDRDRRREAAGLSVEAPSPTAVPSLTSPRPQRPSREADCEQEVDLEPCDLSGHVRDLRRMVAEDADILDPDGTYGETLDRWAGTWGDVLSPTVRPQDGPRAQTVPSMASPPPPARAARRSSG